MPDYMTPPDNPGTFGQEFNYAVWTPGTSVTLCNVPWYSDYRDVVHFDTQTALDTYLSKNSGPTVSITSLMYAKPGRPVRINVPFNDAYNYNYLRVKNDKQPVGETGPRTFYYFISDVNYIAPNTTELVVQLDVWQTFIRTVTLGNSYVERGHVGIANENQMKDYGREYLAIPEGLDTGSEYQVTSWWYHLLAHNGYGINLEDGKEFDVLMLSTISFSNSGGTIESPLINTAKGSGFEGLPNGCDVYVMRQASLNGVLGILSKKPWVSQGIIGIYAIPRLSDTILNRSGSQEYLRDDTDEDFPIHRLWKGWIPPEKITLRTNWRDVAINNLPARYRHLKKFITYPYTVVELTTSSGNPLLLKPESMAGDDLAAILKTHVGPPSPRIACYPYKYNGGRLNDVTVDNHIDNPVIMTDGGDGLDITTGITDLPTFSVVNNSYMSFMASNKNSIAYQHSQADWSQQKALRSNQVTYGQASQGMALQNQLNNLNVGAMGARTHLANTMGNYRTLTNAGTSLAQGLMSGPAGIAGGIMGAATAGISNAIDINERNQSLGIESSLANSTTRAQVNNSAYMRDTNKDFADYAARGDYEQAVAGINAKVQDAKMIQPTTSGQVGGDAFNLATYRWSVDAKVKMLPSGAMATVGEYWLRYGYAVNRFMTPPKNLSVMTKFSYWKMLETYIASSKCPEQFRQTIRGILEKGVTVWSKPEYVGVTDTGDNKPIAGVKY